MNDTTTHTPATVSSPGRPPALPSDRLAAAREVGRRSWATRHPERAAYRAAILATTPAEPCDRCGAEDARLFVVSYETAAHVWRCPPCARTAQAERRPTPTRPRRSRMAAARAAKSRLSPTARAALCVLDDGDETIGTLARALGRASSTTTRLVDGLERRQLVRRVVVKGHGQLVGVRITDRGRALLRGHPEAPGTTPDHTKEGEPGR